MKKQNIKSLKLNKKFISNFSSTTIIGGRITWVNVECATQDCPRSLKCVIATIQKTCQYYSCVVCDG